MRRDALTDPAFPPKPRLIEGGVRDGQWELDCRKWSDTLDRWALAQRPFFEDEGAADRHRDLLRDYRNHDGPPPRASRVRVADAVDRFERFCKRNRRIQERTWLGYQSAFNRLKEFATFTFMDEFTVAQFDDFADELITIGLSAATQRNYCVAVGGLCRFLVRRGEMKLDPTEGQMPAPATYTRHEQQQKLLSDEAIGEIMASDTDRSPIFKLLMCSGMRPCELARLTINDVHLDGKVVNMDGATHPHLFIPGYKKGPDRELPLTPQMVGWVEQIIEVGHGFRAPKSKRVKPHHVDRILGVTTNCIINRWWHQEREACGIDKTLYCMRHTVMTWLVQQYGVHVAGLIGGHSQKTVTARSYWHPSHADDMKFMLSMVEHFESLDKSGIQRKVATG